jgi:hypothetical protein
VAASNELHDDQQHHQQSAVLTVSERMLRYVAAWAARSRVAVSRAVFHDIIRLLDDIDEADSSPVGKSGELRILPHEGRARPKTNAACTLS